MPPVNFRYHTLARQSMNRLALLSRPIARIGLIVELDRNLLVTTKDAEMAASPAIEEVTFIGVSGRKYLNFCPLAFATVRSVRWLASRTSHSRASSKTCGCYFPCSGRSDQYLSTLVSWRGALH